MKRLSNNFKEKRMYLVMTQTLNRHSSNIKKILNSQITTVFITKVISNQLMMEEKELFLQLITLINLQEILTQFHKTLLDPLLT